MRSPAFRAAFLSIGFLLSAGLGGLCVRYFRPHPSVSIPAVNPQERMLSAPSPSAPDDPDRMLLEKVMQGFLEGSSPGEIAELLKSALHRRPREVMAMVFHELSVQDSLALLPMLAPDLAQLPDSVIQTALAEVRTQSELRLAWGEVMRCRIEQDLDSGLGLAKSAPHGADMESSFTALCLNSKGPEVLSELLRKGLPEEWALSGLKDVKVERGLDLVRQLDQHKQGKWSFQDYLWLLRKLPDTAKDGVEIFRFLAESPAWRRTISAERLGLLAGQISKVGLARQKELIASLPEGFAKGLVVQRIKEAVTDSKHFATAGNHKREETTAPAENAESVSAARNQILSEAQIKVAMAGEDDGKQALAWARSQTDEDVRGDALKSVMQALSSLRGPVGPVLAFEAETVTTESALFAGAVDQVLKDVGAREFNPQELSRLSKLAAPVKTALREQLIAKGNSLLAAQVQ